METYYLINESVRIHYADWNECDAFRTVNGRALVTTDPTRVKSCLVRMARHLSARDIKSTVHIDTHTSKDGSRAFVCIIVFPELRRYVPGYPRTISGVLKAIE